MFQVAGYDSWTPLLGDLLAGAGVGFLAGSVADALARRLPGFRGDLLSSGLLILGAGWSASPGGARGRTIFAVVWRMLRERLRASLRSVLTALAGAFS